MSVQLFRELAEAAAIDDNLAPAPALEEALRIRAVEQKFLALFNAGQMNGTVHTCVGQEFSAVAVAGQLTEDDWVTSNHRCHGHFISRTKNWRGLIDELRGLDTGVCRGIGSSQHLYAHGFLSNGLQGAFVPVASGIALHHKRLGKPGIAVSYIGEGTLGEGVLYEAMNLASLYKLPHLIVCENNLYSQSTPQDTGIAGEIAARPVAFGIKVFEADTWNVPALMATARNAIAHVRDKSEPAFLIIRTYRLNAHSKGDDDREKEEIAFFRQYDPIERLLQDPHWVEVNTRIVAEIDAHVDSSPMTVMPLSDYLHDQLPRTVSARLVPVNNGKQRMVQALNQAYKKTLEDGAVHIGEDIHDPYGGAFKVTKGLMDAHPNSVFTTSISEAGLVGIATGLALMGTSAWAEIMFGDFMTNVFDQVINNLAKIHHMYAFQAAAPARIRTPMGGKRGYGPTHSQSLEKLLVGIDNVAVVYLSSLIDPGQTIAEVSDFACPALVMENKVDYGKFLWNCPDDLEISRETRPAGSLLVSPRRAAPGVTLVSYGETARELAEQMRTIFIETDLVPELVVLQMIHPLDTTLIERSVARTGRLVIVEDGSTAFGIGGEIISQLIEHEVPLRKVLRIGAEPVPIPSISSLELRVLPTLERVLAKIVQANLTEIYL
jgi:2-oxoisovalerate dehydrogenase E1 component